jgi:hypothetical protein
VGDGPQLALAEGAGPDATPETDDRAYTDALLARWVAQQSGMFLNVLQDDYALGDQYLIVNRRTARSASPARRRWKSNAIRWTGARFAR